MISKGNVGMEELLVLQWIELTRNLTKRLSNRAEAISCEVG